jgi:hypothetical protein
MELKQNIGLVAHDNKKDDLVEWVAFNKGARDYSGRPVSFLSLITLVSSAA